MPQYKYFEQEGNKFLLRSNNTSAYIRGGICMALALYLLFFVPREQAYGLYFGIFLIFIALGMFLKTTKKLTIDTSARTITDKNNLFFGVKTYHFDDFERFHMAKHYVNMIRVNCLASAIFDQNGKEKHVMLMMTMFAAKPAQRVINEASEIMGVEADL
jgi:hypothetical protein